MLEIIYVTATTKSKRVKLLLASRECDMWYARALTKSGSKLILGEELIESGGAQRTTRGFLWANKMVLVRIRAVASEQQFVERSRTAGLVW